MKALVEIEVPDEFLSKRVEEFNEDVRAGQWGDDTQEATPESYFREIVSGICADEIPTALFSWPLTARVVEGGTDA